MVKTKRQMLTKTFESEFGDFKLEAGITGLGSSSAKPECIDYRDASGNGFARIAWNWRQANTGECECEIEVEGLGAPGTAPIVFAISLDPANLRYWMPWDGPTNPPPKADAPDIPYNFMPDTGMLDTAAWTNPFQPAPLADRMMAYGGHPSLGAGFVLPMISFFRDGVDQSQTLLFTPECPLIEFRAEIAVDGTVRFSDSYHRLEAGCRFRYRFRLLEHRAHWRAALGAVLPDWESALAPVTASPLPEGFGGYTHMDREAGETLDVLAPDVVNWASSFDFPFMGQFIPDTATDEEEWTAISCLGDGRITAGKEIRRSVAAMRLSALAARERGCNELAYFNITEFGFGIRFPRPENGESFAYAPAREASRMLWEQFPNAILFGCHRPIQGPLFRNPSEQHQLKTHFHQRPYWTWGDGLAMDPGEPAFSRASFSASLPTSGSHS